MVSAEKIERFNFLDGLRGWGALAVVLWHVFTGMYPISPESANFLKFLLPFNGIVAVDLFFVVSGFALSIAYVKRHDFKSLARIASSRYPRLAIPILAACALVNFAMASGVIPPFELRSSELQAPGYDSFLRFEPTVSHLFAFSLFDVFFRFSFAQAYIPPLWTMPVELKGSVITILFLAVFGRHERRFWIFGTVLFAVLIFRNSYYSLFVAGMIMAKIYVSRDFSGTRCQVLLLGGFLLGWLTPFLTDNKPSSFYLMVMVILFGSIIWIVPIRKFFESKTSRFLGRISFPLYLMHGPLLWSFSLWFKTLLPPFLSTNGYMNLVVGVTTVIVSIGAAIAFTPINDFAIYVSRRFGVGLVNKVVLGYLFMKNKFRLLMARN